jgi:glucosamine 6-phosphate synthetase-like amidotransferase/phosphosugar isomerase protein
MFKGDEDLIVGARNGPPLAVGHGDGEMYLGSDAIALAPFTNSITYLEDGDWAVVRRNHVQIYDMAGEPVQRKRQQSIGTSFLVDKGNHRHFMHKEIHEQPEVISHTLGNYIDFTNGKTKPLELPWDFAKLDRLAISACGTAYLAALSANTGSSVLRACRSTSILPRNSATAKCRCRRTARLFSCHSPARQPTLWRLCGTAAERDCPSARSSTCASRPLRGNRM